MTMHVLHIRRLISSSFVPVLEPNEHISGTLGTVAFGATERDLEKMREEAANAMDLDSSDQLKWVEVVVK